MALGLRVLMMDDPTFVTNSVLLLRAKSNAEKFAISCGEYGFKGDTNSCVGGTSGTRSADCGFISSWNDVMVEDNGSVEVVSFLLQ